MISSVSLWLPILLAAVFVFFVSFVLHMVVPWHKGDFKKLPAEDEIRDALRRHSLPPGEYATPYGGGPEAMKDPAFLQKMKDGPVLLITARQPGGTEMGTALIQWFGYCLLVGAFTAFVAGRVLSPGAGYPAVFHLAGMTAFAGYGLAQFQESIWHARPWGTTIRNVIDGLVFGLITGGTFGWLWPK